MMPRRMLSSFLALAIGLQLAATAASSAPTKAKAPRQSYMAVWTLGPDEEVEPTKWVAPHTSIASARLLPPSAYVAGGDAKTAKGKLLVPAGMELGGLLSDATVACTLKPPARTGLEALKWMDRQLFVCLVDSDRNGDFDQYLWLVRPRSGVLIGRGNLPQKRNLIAPVPYTAKDPRDLTTAPRIHVRYGWFASLVNTLVFQICFTDKGYHNDGKCLVEDAGVNRSALPQTFELLGARFRVEDKQEDRVQVTMESQFAAQPFFVMD